MASNLSLKDKASLIAGHRGGKKVYVANKLKPKLNKLADASKRNNHWARCVVKGLLELNTGRVGKDNIFVKSTTVNKPDMEGFYVMLPGCKASVVRLPSDAYVVVDLELDTTYFEMQNDVKTATGLYRATKTGRAGNWVADFVNDGKIKPNGDPRRLVGVSDGKYDNADVAVDNLSRVVTKSPAGGGVGFKEFDMHYTNNPQRFGGLVRYNDAKKPLEISSANGSAIMLADTMIQAKDIEGVTWVAEQGGSAVLTQAMKILADRNVKLKNHSAFLFRPTTSVSEAVEQAHRLNLALDRNFVKTGVLDIAGNREQIAANWKRWRNKDSDKNYHFGNMVWDNAGQIKNVYGVAGMTVSALAYAGVSMAAPAIPALTTLATVLGGTALTFKIGDTIAEAVAPRKYEKHIGKIK